MARGHYPPFPLLNKCNSVRSGKALLSRQKKDTQDRTLSLVWDYSPEDGGDQRGGVGCQHSSWVWMGLNMRCSSGMSRRLSSEHAK